jgi:hypothetical protein
MDEETKLLLVTITHTIVTTLLWMLLNMTFGIWFGYGFFDNGFSWKNVVYFIFFIGSGIFLGVHLYRRWKKIM